METAPNEGPIVEQMLAPWTSRPPGAWALWCAFTASTAVLRVLETRPRDFASPDDITLTLWKRIGSGAVSTLWEHLAQLGVVSLYRPSRAGDLRQGDLLFIRERAEGESWGRFSHVTFFDKLEGNEIVDLGGNQKNGVLPEHRNIFSPTLFGSARLR